MNAPVRAGLWPEEGPQLKVVPTARVVVGQFRVRQELRKIDELAASIEALGQLAPIILTPERVLVSGERRLAACKLLGVPALALVASTAKEAVDLLHAEYAENSQREELTQIEKFRYLERVEQLAQEEAAKRQQEGRRRGGRARAAGDASGARAPEAERTSDEAGRALDRLAKDLGLGSRRTVERLRKVVRKAEEDPERYGELVDRLNAGVAVGTVVKELERIDEGCGRDDYASPEWIPAGVRQVEGRPIDLDPATNANAIALGFVAALTAWTIDENALAQPTWGVGGLETLVYMNPPYSDPGPLVMRLSEEFDAGAVARAYVLVKLDTSTSWWRALRERAAFVVEPDKRVAHYVGKRPKKGSDFCSAMVVLARGTGLELLDLYGRLIDEFGDRADVRPTRWALQYMRALQRKLREART